MKLFNAFVNSAVATRNEDIFNPTIVCSYILLHMNLHINLKIIEISDINCIQMVLTFLVMSVGLIFVVVVTPTLEEQVIVSVINFL